MSEPILNTTLQLHAHKCQKCAANGVETLWIHPDICRGKVAAHTCPKCGSVEWKQCQVETGKLPRVTEVQQGPSVETIIGYVVLAVSLAVLGYVAFVYFKERRKGKTAV